MKLPQWYKDWGYLVDITLLTLLLHYLVQSYII